MNDATRTLEKLNKARAEVQGPLGRECVDTLIDAVRALDNGDADRAVALGARVVDLAVAAYRAGEGDVLAPVRRVFGRERVEMPS